MFVVFTDSDYAGCLGRCTSTASSERLYGSHMLRGTSRTGGLGAVSMLKDLGVDISKNTKIDQAVREVRTDASAVRGTTARRGFGTLPLQHCECLSLHKMAKSKSMEPRTRQISEPSILTEDQFEEYWKSVIVTFVKEGVWYRVASSNAQKNETTS